MQNIARPLSIWCERTSCCLRLQQRWRILCRWGTPCLRNFLSLDFLVSGHSRLRTFSSPGFLVPRLSRPRNFSPLDFLIRELSRLGTFLSANFLVLRLSRPQNFLPVDLLVYEISPPQTFSSAVFLASGISCPRNFQYPVPIVALVLSVCTRNSGHFSDRATISYWQKEWPVCALFLCIQGRQKVTGRVWLTIARLFGHHFWCGYFLM